MHLKRLTMKGFKSFASATEMRLEPGITCVVGPNGSGKSNVVDAITWVLGEQGAKALRGGKMEDVIFAGTAGRPPLGRAEVTLTIDNTDGALPIDYSEVSITRRMFRDGAGEYEINGNTCRLLDIQELLSDSGIGREMHVVVGQGQLEAILSAKPEDRRAFVEEAAGVLKHRKRKEKALRKLDAMQTNLTRLTDLTGELRRQLKPLGKQAEIARRAQTVQSELRDSRLRLAADDLVTLRDGLAKEEADEAVARARRAEIEELLVAGREELARREAELAAAQPALTSAQETWYRLSSLQERLRGTVRLAAERGRHLSEPVEAGGSGRDPDELEAEAETIAEQEDQLVSEVVEARRALNETVESVAAYERALADAERAHLAAVRAVADRKAGLATLAGRAEALRSKSAATAEEIERLSAALAEARARTESAEAELSVLQADYGALEDGPEGQEGLDHRGRGAVDAHEDAKKRVANLVAEERALERDRAHWKGRVEALSLGLKRKDGAAAVLAAKDRLPGLRGSLAGLVTVEPGAEAALAAALGGLAEGVAMASSGDAVEALNLLKNDSAGRVGIVVGGADTGPEQGRPPLPSDARWADELVDAPAELRSALRRALVDVVVVPDVEAAERAVAAMMAERPSVRAVTRDGDLFGAGWALGGSTNNQSAIEVQAAIDEASEASERADAQLERLRAVLDGARAEEAARLADVEAAQEAQSAADARRTAVAQRLGRADQAVRSASAEAERLQRQRDDVETSRIEALGALEDAEQRLEAAQDEPTEDEPDTEIREEAAEALSEARGHEMEARLALRTAEERARAIAGRAESLRRQASSERAARERVAAARASRERGAAIAEAVRAAGETALTHIELSLETAAAERESAKAARDSGEVAVGEVKAQVGRLAAELERLTDTVHRDEVLRAQSRLRVEQLETRIASDFGMGLEELVSEYGPDQDVPPGPGELAEYEAAKERGEDVVAPPSMPYERAAQERRAQRAQRDLNQLGKVNPLALEEFAALEERYKFLSTQLEDLKATRRDLLIVVREVDEKILEVFAAAFTDVAREFEIVFATLFPGGEGKLILTDPDDLLTTGVEVEARPPGKKIKRLSLLSGGEKSLTAVAMLVAIFRARPSPFYVMDEIEAALDDTNLRRLIGLLEELRQTSQLVIITHQKPTMEVADALYGVSMRGDGITTVISQRLREAAR
ncbi:chromosome segregation protein SMC [Pseudonocardia spinosispora]|uniref:chromosome segregation protein SMC n=1 Tax=Pseudonocardia spinosispora TaxID=103441 RepID=UPI0004043708|nr:chromosome segregation protein SMC [Pseudonocardia spinosispora]